MNKRDYILLSMLGVMVGSYVWWVYRTDQRDVERMDYWRLTTAKLEMIAEQGNSSDEN